MRFAELLQGRTIARAFLCAATPTPPAHADLEPRARFFAYPPGNACYRAVGGKFPTGGRAFANRFQLVAHKKKLNHLVDRSIVVNKSDSISFANHNTELLSI